MKKIFLYGNVGLDFDARSVAKELSGGDDLEVHINSNGGNVFDSLAIYNMLKQYKGTVTIYIDGLAASAASLIVCAGDRVYMAENGVVMIHLPAAGLDGFYRTDELDKVTAMLSTLRDSIVTTYETRTRQPRAKLEEMMDAETWLDAAEAKALGFVDEIIESVEAEYDDSAKVLFVNSMRVKLDCREFSQFEKIMAAVKPATKKEETVMAEEKQLDLEQVAKDATNKERARINSLLALKCENSAVNAVVDLAIADGTALGDIQKYVDAVKNATPPKPVTVEKPALAVEPKAVSTEKMVADRICAMIRDNMQSGAQEVTGSVPEQVAQDEKEKQSELLAKYVNQRLKGGVVR